MKIEKEKRTRKEAKINLTQCVTFLASLKVTKSHLSSYRRFDSPQFQKVAKHELAQRHTVTLTQGYKNACEANS